MRALVVRWIAFFAISLTAAAATAGDCLENDLPYALLVPNADDVLPPDMAIWFVEDPMVPPGKGSWPQLFAGDNSIAVDEQVTPLANGFLIQLTPRAPLDDGNYEVRMISHVTGRTEVRPFRVKSGDTRILDVPVVSSARSADPYPTCELPGVIVQLETAPPPGTFYAATNRAHMLAVSTDRTLFIPGAPGTELTGTVALYAANGSSSDPSQTFAETARDPRGVDVPSPDAAGCRCVGGRSSEPAAVLGLFGLLWFVKRRSNRTKSVVS